MQEQTQQGHTLMAWTKEGDFIPTLYIQGEISTNGEKVLVELKEKNSKERVSQELLLEFSHDVYDPAGKSKLKIKNYEKKLKSDDEYMTVNIASSKGNIKLNVERKPR
ncbi:MAG: hypothetical protein ACR2KX_13200 [Chitinophagaceae bacterium]